MDRFDLEEQIMICWQTKNDIDLLSEEFLKGSVHADEFSKILAGVSAIHDLRCKKLFDIFENLVNKRLIN